MTGVSPVDSAQAGVLPTISIVLPVYNGARFLRPALDSVFAQTFGDFELIAVDDCSTDATPSILAEYAARDPRMRVITNPANCKLPASLNTGFAQARGQWLTWTSDDNLLLPEMLAQLLDAASGNPQADIIHADYRVIDENGDERARVTTGPDHDLVIDNTIGCCFLYRREVDTALGGYDEGLFGVEDYDFWLRARDHGFSFRRLASAPYLYRRHDGSLTDTRARRIHALLHERLAGVVSSLPRSRQRARARIRLVTRNPYTFRPHLLFAACIDSPAMVAGQWRTILRWLRTSLGVRARGLLGQRAA
ncbi:glycosyltransferase family 2 protein [Aurantiacibacter marinus]|uniref:Glycosyltransferase 2-like domain-containing protein n=1 Tax=Aurantiacibacter marinus TaxID=874156 RepID=A0A0H0XRW1_9SPHN|nr:glycosyltransferase [Aurantiacibacter marinus]KLI65303.1 hypothetical protein AAV99_06165 [Aurantiacibacter marinus]